MLLFFDTETTGLPKNYKAPITDLNNWPRLVQLAYLLYDADGNLISSKDYLIKPDGFTIPEGASRIHGITTERAINFGIPIATVLSQFNDLVNKCEVMVAHNISFDEKIVGSELIRNGMANTLALKKKICTMQSTTDFCAISGYYGNKWPKLSELHYKLFNIGFDEAHDASVDIKATAKCFWELKRRGILKPVYA
jgi:DNA polymerase III subunit epsilon